MKKTLGDTRMSPTWKPSRVRAQNSSNVVGEVPQIIARIGSEASIIALPNSVGNSPCLPDFIVSPVVTIEWNSLTPRWIRVSSAKKK